MWMTSYIASIQKHLVQDFGMSPRQDNPDVPAHVPDGIYPMTINGRLDQVRIEDGRISCCNFEPTP
jgi:hypothetical protein